MMIVVMTMIMMCDDSSDKDGYSDYIDASAGDNSYKNDAFI